MSLLPAPTPVPAGVTPMTFGPAALGASLSVPTGWVDRGPAAGAQFSIRSVGQPVDFILASSRPWTTTDAAAVALSRSTFLGRLDTTIASVTTGVVAGHPAARLRYQITVGGQSARDVEYDILTGSDVITIIIGTSQTRPDTALVNWIASTLNVQ
ncbi:MAG TPA: hypothetical protein VFH70_02165 [Acidimicrobiales bacterium]|nr:hypothetical protein [Acidimicrobiales bacterium]